jgi:hypothetical protein
MKRMGPFMPGNLRHSESPGVPYIARRYVFVVFIAIHIPGGLQRFDMVEADGSFALLPGPV